MPSSEFDNNQKLVDMPPRRLLWFQKKAKTLGYVLSQKSIASIVLAIGPRCWATDIPKVQYSTLKEGYVGLGRDLDKHVYPCAHCDFWHVGKDPTKDPKDNRGRARYTKEEAAAMTRATKRAQEKRRRQRRKAAGK